MSVILQVADVLYELQVNEDAWSRQMEEEEEEEGRGEAMKLCTLDRHFCAQLSIRIDLYREVMMRVSLHPGLERRKIATWHNSGVCTGRRDAESPVIYQVQCS